MRRPSPHEATLLVVTTLACVGGVVLAVPPRGPDQPSASGPPPATAAASPDARAPLSRGYGVALAPTADPSTLAPLGPLWYWGGRPAASNSGRRIEEVPVEIGASDLKRAVAHHPATWWIIGADTDPTAPNPDARAYAHQFARIADGIHSADPAAALMPAPIAGADPSWAAAFFPAAEQETGHPPAVDAWNVRDFLLESADHYDFFVLKADITRFRAWMGMTGEGRKPLVLGQFGVLYGAGCCGRPLDTRGQGLAFLQQALAWLESSGQVDSWAWYTTDSGDAAYAGDLLRHAVPGTLSPFGSLYADHAAAFTGP